MRNFLLILIFSLCTFSCNILEEPDFFNSSKTEIPEKYTEEEAKEMEDRIHEEQKKRNIK